MALRNIQVGDNLSSKTIYLNFPNNFGISENSHDIFIESIDGLSFNSNFSGSGLNTSISILYPTDSSSLYVMYQGVVSLNLSSYIVRNVNFIVSYVDISNPAYQYIKIQVPDPPIITQVIPNTGVESGGTSVVITGTDLTGATSVSFGGINSPSFTVNSSTQITAVTPAHAVGAVTLSVTTPYGTGSLASAFIYTQARPSKCRVLEISDTIANGESLYFNFPSSPFMPITNTALNSAIGFMSLNSIMSDSTVTPAKVQVYYYNYISPVDTPMLYLYNNSSVFTNLASYALSQNESVNSVDKSHQYYHSVKKHDPNLRNIVVGDNLTNRTIYFDFPNNLNTSISPGDASIIIDCQLDSTHYAQIRSTKPSTITSIFTIDNTGSASRSDIYTHDGVSGPSINKGYALGNDFIQRVVTSINSTHPAYQYIYILDAPSSPYSVWDGSTWKVISPKVYDGTTWKNINV